ncbi:MAG: MarR family transcriptional regulator [Candidatus Aenigmarchaeota archaeon]|nr:MarR family transcriptional regulator [Candidatus Aenigmarchaeota archaeon]
MQKMLKYIGIFLIIVSLGLGLFSLYNKINSDNLATELMNETGSCYIGSTCLHDQSNINFTIILGSAVILLFVGLGILLINNIKSKETVKEIIIKKYYPKPKYLSQETKKIYEIISNSEGSILQGELVTKSGMNKVKVSRLLDKMEIQGLVERKRHGMSNIVILKSK